MVSYAQSACGRRVECERAGVCEVGGVFEALPFSIGEEAAPGGVPERVGLVWAHGLCSRGVSEGPVVAGNHVLQSTGSVGKINRLPEATGVEAAEVDSQFRVVTDEKARQAGVVPDFFDKHLEGGILRPVLTEEATHEVFGPLNHSILRGCTSNDLGGWVVQLGVLIVMVHASVKHPICMLALVKVVTGRQLYLTLDVPKVSVSPHRAYTSRC